MIRFALALGLLLQVTGCDASPADGPTRLAAASIYVTDGDTIRLASGERVRLAGIDAPELPPRAGCEAEAALALASKARLLELVRMADQIAMVRPDGETRDSDRYGRLLRDLHIDGADAGEVLISEGLAQRWRGRKAAWCDQRSALTP